MQQETLGRRGHRDDPLYRIRRVLRRAAEHLTPTGWARLETGLSLGDPHGQVTAAWMVAQELRLLYARSRDLGDARHRLHRLLVRCADSNIPELHRLARTLDTWREELLAYFTTGGISNGPTEAINLLIKRINRVRIPQLRQLPAATTAPLRRRLTHSPRHPGPRSATTLVA